MLADTKVRAGLIFLLLVGIALALVVWKTGLNMAELKGMWKSLETYLKEHPAALFLAIVILPGLPFPTSALLLVAGVVWRDNPLMACSLSMLALTLNLSWTYWLAAGPARSVVEKILNAVSVKIPVLPSGDNLKLILVLKLTPGIPLFLQNYFLGLLRAPFRLYLPISVLCNGIIGCGIVLSGAGLSNSKITPVITGLSLVVVSSLLANWIRGWLAKRKQAVVES